MTRTWLGNVDTHWSTPGNWSPVGAPQDGDTLVFPQGSPTLSDNDLTDVRIASILFNSGGYSLSGNPIRLDSDITDNRTGGIANWVYLDLHFTSGGGSINVIGSFAGSLLDIGGTISLANNQQLTLLVLPLPQSTASGIQIEGAIQGAGSVVKVGDGQLVFPNSYSSTQPNSYTGGTYFKQGTIRLRRNDSGTTPLVSIPGNGPLVIGVDFVSQATVYCEEVGQLADGVAVEIHDSHFELGAYDARFSSLTVTRSATMSGTGTVTLLGGITATTDPATLVDEKLALPGGAHLITTTGPANQSQADLKLLKPISGAGGITKFGTGRLTLAAANSFNGEVLVSDGTLELGNGAALGSTAGGTTLSGSGGLWLNHVQIVNETLFVRGNKQWVSAIAGSMIGGPAGDWTGPIQLDTNLVVFCDFYSPDAFSLSGPISGPGGIEFSAGEGHLAGTSPNTYTGPTWVHCVLLNLNKPSGVQAVGGSLIVGDESVNDRFEARWLAPYQHVYTPLTIYSNGVVNLNNNNEDFGVVSLYGGEIDTGTGQFGVYQPVTAYPSATSAVINGVLGLPVAAYPNNPFNVSNSPGVIPPLMINATVLGGGGLIKNGAGTLALAANNSYTGLTIINDGILEAGANNALGAAGSGQGTFVQNGATLRLAPGITIQEPLFLSGAGFGGTNGALNVSGVVNFNNPLALTSRFNLSNPSTIRVDGSASVFSIFDAVTGTGPLTKVGAGRLVLAGSGANTYIGGTVDSEGPLELAKPQFVVAAPGNLTIGPAPASAPAVVQLDQTGELGGNTVTVNANALLDLNNNNATVSLLTLNDGGTVQTRGGTLAFFAGGLIQVGSQGAFGSHAGASIFGHLAIAPNDMLTFNINPRAPFPPFDFQPELSVAAGIAAPGESSQLAPARIIKQGIGQLKLSGNSTYNGLTIIDEGTLIAASAGALGSTNLGTAVNNGAMLALDGGISINSEVVYLASTNAPALDSWNGINNWNGAVSLSLSSIINVSSGGTLNINGAITGAGSVTKTGPGTLTLLGSANNTFSGNTLVNDGLLQLGKTYPIVAVPANLVIGPTNGVYSATVKYLNHDQVWQNITVNGGGLLDLNGWDEYEGSLTLNNGGSVQTGIGSLYVLNGGIIVNPGSNTTSTISGKLGFDAGTQTINVGAGTTLAGAHDLEISATIFQANPTVNLVKAGAGRLRFRGTNTYTGTTTISGGWLQVDGVQPQSPMVISNSSRLQGTGTVGHITFAGGSGVVAPGASPGILTCSNFNAGAAGGTLEIELNGTSPGTGYDQLNVRGTVNLTGVALKPSLGFGSAVNDTFTIIANDGADATIGTFSGMTQGKKLYIGRELFQVGYNGGTGNDVVLTRLTTPPPPALTIEKVDPASVRLFWATNDPAFDLQASTNLLATNWVAALPLPVVIGTNNVVTNAAGGIERGYRLVSPSF